LSDDHFRHYRVRWLRVSLRAGNLAFALIIVGIVLGTAHEAKHCTTRCGSTLTTTVVLGAIWLAIVVWTECVTIKTGLEERQDGYVIRRNFGHSHLRFTDVVRFAHTTGRISTVYALREDGKRVLVPGLVEGRRVVWDSGQTCHIVDVLNARLGEQRLISTHQPPM